MTQLPMPEGKVGSPISQLTEAITASSTRIYFDTSNLPTDVPNMCTISLGDDYETVWYTVKELTYIDVSERGFDGTTAQSWDIGSNVARYVCNYDFTSRSDNIIDHETRIGTLESAPSGDFIPKVTTPTTGNFPQLDTDGALVNSTYDETSFATSSHTHDYSGSFLGLTAKAADADMLDGHHSGEFATSDHTHATMGLDDLVDIVITSPTTGQVLAYNGTVFANADPPAGGAEVWTEVTDVTASPPSTSTLTLTADLTATIKPGMPIKFIDDGDPYYAICTAITSSLLTIAGAPIEGAIDALYYGDPTRVIPFPVLIPGYYEDATDTTLMANDLGWTYPWPNVAAYLVRVSAKTRVADSSSNGVVNARVNGVDVLSTGLTLANTNVTTSVVQIATAAYDIQFGELLDVSATKGTGGNAQDLSMILTFVIP